MDRTTVLRTLHAVGAAAWFGGSLMGAVGLNAAADEMTDPADRERVVSAGWGSWTPFARAAMATHLLGSVGLLASQRSRGAALGLGLGAAAVGVTAGTAVLGSRPDTSHDTMHRLEWAVPALLAGVVALGARRS